ncbi:pyridine nucleotide-disulfide oxidoreductase-like protein [Coniochaeta ligniaria NRRL 30616]|uniref:Pyridine nucleotide-disulfide oxidoreductase-like protein n=1 Tax=Coniochaeta ligniaria NRRL 30616 TaxID=1408157 RepID=A0A1J7I4W5_9PEZI|nr:pyridine nucleotide-disulfide oxidoreductase-like protein [Coniochaeta ligniaria NRRL 30616]
MGSLFVNATRRPFRVLVLGGSYAGLSAALNLSDLCLNKDPRCGKKTEDAQKRQSLEVAPAADITIVDERDGFCNFAEKAWVKYENIPALQIPNIRVIQGSVRGLHTLTKVASVATHGSTDELQLEYDYLVAATGLRRAWPVVPQSHQRKKYLLEVGGHLRNVQDAKHGVVVVGGGAVGIEMAAELKLIQPHTEVTLVHSREKLLSAEPLPDEVKDKALELVREASVNVLMSHRLKAVEEVKAEGQSRCFDLKFNNGHSMRASEVIMAISNSVPSTTFLPQAALDEEGYVRIHANLSFSSDIPNSSDHFAAGDLVRWSGIKRCGAAMHMGYLAAVNIHQLFKQSLSGSVPEFEKLDEIPPMIGLAVGKQAVAYWPEGGTTSGDDVMETFFGKDLGLTICWNHLQLGIKV